MSDDKKEEKKEQITEVIKEEIKEDEPMTPHAKRKKQHQDLLEKIKSKRDKNRLVVDEASNDDNSVVTIHPDTMEELQLFKGDTVKIVGKKKDMIQFVFV